MKMLRISYKAFCCLLVLLFIASPAFAQQVTDAQFKKADDEYNRLSSELNKLHNEMSKAGESRELDRYNELKKQYDKVAADRKKHEQVRMNYLKQNKELVNVKKIYNEGNQAYKLGKMQLAVTKYNDAVSKGKAANSPALSDVISKSYYQLGLIHKKNRKYQDALGAFNNAIKFSPSSALGYFALGNTYKDMSQYNTAITNYKKAIDINPSMYQAYYNMGTVYVRQANKLSKGRSSSKVALLKKAESVFRDAVRINSSYAPAVASLGRVLVDTKRQTEGILMLNKAIKLKKNYLPYYYLAVAYNQLNDPGSAIDSANKCLRYRRNYAAAYMEIGDAHLKRRNEKLAIQAYSKAAKNRSYRKIAEYKIDMIKNKDKYIQ
ncbi:tetratricopeptide repeat protein [bacterium]|nr:tetratricopeptide repeat protein [bacterium]